MGSTGGYGIVRFSSRALPAYGRGRAIEELHERGLLLSRFTPQGEAPPQVDVVSRSLPGLRILGASYSGVRHEGAPTRSRASDGEDLALCMILSGTSLATRTSREVLLRNGDAVLMSNVDGWSFTPRAGVDVAGLRLSRARLAPLVPDLDAAVMRRVPADIAGLSLLRKYLALVTDDEQMLTDAASQSVITHHLYDLAALALGATRDGTALATRRTLGAVRLASIKDDIVAHLSDGDLDPATVAARNRVSPRYLHKLFQNDGATYSAFVLSRRLARAHALLNHPLHEHRPIGAIAYAVGFNDLSYFNRAFRRRYDATPSDVREAAARRRAAAVVPTPETGPSRGPS
jgi:AraC-like DNA-binding protein